MAAAFQIPDQLLYDAPKQTLSGDKFYSSFAVQSGSTFNSTQSFKINVNNRDCIMIPNQSYLKFDLKLVQPTVFGATQILSSLGAASVLRNVSVDVGGYQVDQILNYNQKVSLETKRAPASQQNLLQYTELRGGTQGSLLSGTSTQATAGRTICVALRTPVMEAQSVPLPVISGGISISVDLETFANVIKSTTSAATDYQISNISFVACLIKPDAGYLTSLLDGISRGQSAKIPLVGCRNVRFQPSSILENRSIFQLGGLKSIRSILGSCRVSATLNSATVDAFANDTTNRCKEYSFEIQGQRYPRNSTIKCCSAVADGTPSPEWLMQGLVSLDNNYSQFWNPSDVSTDTDAFFYYNWQSSADFGTGVALPDGQMTMVHSYFATPQTTDTYDIFVYYDQVLHISADNIFLDTKVLT